MSLIYDMLSEESISKSKCAKFFWRANQQYTALGIPLPSFLIWCKYYPSASIFISVTCAPI